MTDVPDYLPSDNFDEEAYKREKADRAGELPPPNIDEAEAHRRLALMLGAGDVILVGGNDAIGEAIYTRRNRGNSIINEAVRHVVDENLNRDRTTPQVDNDLASSGAIAAADITADGLPRPLTPEEEAELIAIEDDIATCYSRYKKHSKAAYNYRLRMGAKLIRAKEITHGRFLKWREEHCPFEIDTGNKYMVLAAANLEFITFMNLAEQAEIEAVERFIAHRDRLAAEAQYRKAQAQEQEAEWAEQATQVASTQSTKKPAHRAGSRDRITTQARRKVAAQAAAPIRQAAREKVEAAVAAIGLPDLSIYKPQDDATGLVIEGKIANPKRMAEWNDAEWLEGGHEETLVYDHVLMYVWLPQHAHRDALEHKKPVKYKWIILRKEIFVEFTGSDDFHNGTTDISGGGFDGGDGVRDGRSWKEVEEEIIKTFKGGEIVHTDPIERNTRFTEALGMWRAGISRGVYHFYKGPRR